MAKIKSSFVGFDFTIMLEKTNSYSYVFFMLFWKAFFELIFNGPFLALLNPLSWSIGNRDCGHFKFNNGCHVPWYIMHDFIWEYLHLWVFLCDFYTLFFPCLSANLVLYTSYELKSILIWGLIRIECHVVNPWLIFLAYITHFPS